MDLSKTQANWLAKVKRYGRVRVGAVYHAGMPKRTAESLRKKGLIRLEYQPVFRKSNCQFPLGLFAVVS